jgi:hypothetical protein
MNRVIFNEQSEQDLSDIIIGLLLWKKAKMTEEQAFQYVDDIYYIAYTIPNMSYHQKCKFKIHRRYGAYHLKYKRNNRTTWYIIYDIDTNSNDILIQRIISNYKTIE